VSEGDFAFNANEAGEYIACFWISDASKESEATVELEWKTGVAAKDWDSVAKREKIEVKIILDLHASLFVLILTVSFLIFQSLFPLLNSSP
jgi:hypothetical protein